MVACVDAAPPNATNWTIRQDHLRFDADAPLIGETNGKCSPRTCDLIVRITFLGGDLVGGGSLHLGGFAPEDQAFRFLAGGKPFLEPAQAFFFRRDPFNDDLDRDFRATVAAGGLISAILTRQGLFDFPAPSTDEIGTFALTVAYNTGDETIGRGSPAVRPSRTLFAHPKPRLLYDQHRANGDLHWSALRALANRLIGILHGCPDHHTPYNEHTACAHPQPPQIKETQHAA